MHNINNGPFRRCFGFRCGSNCSEANWESDLYYYNARYYNPEIGRFISPDPFVPHLFNPQSLNRFSYVMNNPVNRIDPSGYADVTLTNSSGGGGSISVEPITVINWGDIPQNGRTSGGATAPTAVAAPLEGFGVGAKYIQDGPRYFDRLTFSDATAHWREGKGREVVVDIASLDLSNVCRLSSNGLVKFIGPNFSSLNDALVYGTLTLFLGPNNAVIGGRDTYNFDEKDWDTVENIIRNIQTRIGKRVAGPGIPFKIKFEGTVTLPSCLGMPSWSQNP